MGAAVRTEDEAVPAPAPASDENGRGGGDGGRHDDEGGTGGGGGSHLQKARREGKLDLRNSWQVVAGAILIPLGVVLILHRLVRGGARPGGAAADPLHGVAARSSGWAAWSSAGFLFFGHWLYRMYDQAELHHEEYLRVLQAIAAGAAWRGAVWGRAPAGLGTGRRAGGGRRWAPPTYYATATGTVYHRADCAVIAHHPDDLRVLGADGVSGLRPCQICSPD